MDTTLFRTTSLDALEAGENVKRILAAALEAVDPAEAVRRNVQRYRDRLSIGERSYGLGEFQRVLVVGAGKAGAPMAEAIEEILGDKLSEGVVIVKEGYGELNSLAKASESPGRQRTMPKKSSPNHESNAEPSQGLITILEAGHPMPDERSVEGAKQIIDLLESAREDDLVICLISGGGSALLTSPDDGISLDDLKRLTSALLASGANINEINALRKHLDRLKGGKLARLAAPAQVATLILSDVVGDSLDVIASGPTVPDLSTFEEAYQVLERYNLLEKAPKSVVEHLKKGLQGEIPENPKIHDPFFGKVFNEVVGSNLLAAGAAVEKARKEGFNALLLTTYLQGEARQAGRVLGAVARQIAATGQPLPRPACVVVGGETTVTIRGNGYGGRNQETALAAVADIGGLRDIALICLATDGGDGPTDAAGAVVTGETLERAQQQGLEADVFLTRNDSYHFFEPLGDLIKTGPTQTNVNDLAFVFAF